MKKNTKSILILVAHQDDESISMGGTIAKHVRNGDKVFALNMTDGVGARQHNDKDISKRVKSAEAAAKQLGFKWLKSPNFPDNQLDAIPILSIVKTIESVKDKINPDIIYTHNGADLNIDHRKVFEASLTAFRPQPNENWYEIRVFEVPSATDYGQNSFAPPFQPNLYIDISKYWDKKVLALKAYKAELRNSPHSRSLKGIKNLAHIRGNESGLIMAEAFQVIKKIER